MTTIVHEPSRVPGGWISRQRDQRKGLERFVIALSTNLARDGAATLREAFEAGLRDVVPVRAIRLRDGTTRWSPREAVPSAESVAFDVPGRGGGVLEAAFDAGCPLGDWDFQTLGVAVHVGALVLELDREQRQRARAGVASGARVRPEPSASPIIGSSAAIGVLRSSIERVAVTDFTILLEGESGVGKELVARQIHESSRRRHGPFVALNCAALVETLVEAELFGIEERTATGVRGRRGKFELADGGTLFLDEVSDLSPAAQAKLLRVIQDLSVERVGGQGTHRVDVRIVAATNRPLAALVESKLFRPDLYYRLSGVDLRVPALRERRGDILELAASFLDRYRGVRKLRLSTAAADALLSHQWPGNVRELERLIEHAVAFAEGDAIELHDLPPAVRGDYERTLGPSLQRNDSMRAWGSRYARLVLDRCRGNKREACRILSISYHTLVAYLRYPLHESHGGADLMSGAGEDAVASEIADASDALAPNGTVETCGAEGEPCETTDGGAGGTAPGLAETDRTACSRASQCLDEVEV